MLFLLQNAFRLKRQKYNKSIKNLIQSILKAQFFYKLYLTNTKTLNSVQSESVVLSKNIQIQS